MENQSHEFGDLFAQLGLPHSEDDIRRFISTHSLPEDTLLPDAEFWSPTQADFLREAWKADADWVAVIDQLNMALHISGGTSRRSRDSLDTV